MPNRDIKAASQLPPSSSGVNQNLLGVFGGESFGFASSVLHEATKSFYSSSAVPDSYTVANGMTSPVPRSIFNKYALFNFRGMYGGLVGAKPFSEFFDMPNNEIVGGYNAHNVTISRIIEFFNTHYPKIGYKAQDFLYHKYYKSIPVNHLITLRRFPTPINDNIFDLSARFSEDINVEQPVFKTEDATQVAGVTAVTYLGETAGNKLDDILKFTYGLNWKELKAEMEAIESGGGGYTQQPFYNKLPGIGRAVLDVAKGQTAGSKFRAQGLTGGDRLGTTYANFVIGPVNVVDSTTIRDTGIKFENDINLVFEYQLKSLNYVNPKIAMIDIISNMLTMTTNNAQFFGGGHRYYGSAGYVASAFGDMGKLRNGDFAGYIGSVVRDVNTGFKTAFGGPNGDFSIENGLQGLANIGKTFLGNILGGFLGEQMGAIGSTQATKAFISAEPTGDWHLTIGNPLNPIAMMGNMYCDNAVMTLGNGLGYDDFPMEVKFEISVKHGKPRDKGDIENMFNAGRGRIYAAAADTNDVLNLRGIDYVTYGSIRQGNINLQNSQSASITSSASTAEAPSNLISNTAPPSITGETDQYISNLVAMMVES